MIKNIMVALDDSESSESAKKFSQQLAKVHKSTITGIGVVDEMWVATPEALPLGGAAFKAELDEKLLEDAKKRVHHLEKTLTDECKSQSIPCKVIDASGFPVSEIEQFLIDADLLIIGKNADFHFGQSTETAGSVKQLIKDNPRPVIVSGPTLPNQSSTHVVVAFDGTFAASRSLHTAILLGMFKGKIVHIVYASPHEKEAQEKVDAAIKLCQNHGIQAQPQVVITKDRPSKAILGVLEEVKPSLLVVGAYGHGGISHLFFGSCVKDLLQSTDVPIFVYH